MSRFTSFAVILLLFSISACKEKYREQVISVHPNNAPALIHYFAEDDTTNVPVKVVRFYINSEKREEYYMKNGKRHGACTMWHVNGKKKTECNYFEDVYDGEYTEWFDDGNKNYEGFFDKGNATGKWRFYNRDGSLQSETVYD